MEKPSGNTINIYIWNATEKERQSNSVRSLSLRTVPPCKRLLARSNSVHTTVTRYCAGMKPIISRQLVLRPQLDKLNRFKDTRNLKHKDTPQINLMQVHAPLSAYLTSKTADDVWCSRKSYGASSIFIRIGQMCNFHFLWNSKWNFIFFQKTAHRTTYRNIT
jgi:hypothetical protein